MHEDDIVIYNFPYPLVDLAVLFGLIRGTLIVWWHCDFNIKGKLANAMFRPLVNHTLKKANKTIVSSEGNIAGSETLRKYADKCAVIPFAVDQTLIEEGKNYYRSERQAQPSAPVHALFIGRFVWYKGIDVLLKAYSELDQSKYELTLVGDGPLFDDMKKLADSLHLAHVNFTGHVSGEEKKRMDQMVRLSCPSFHIQSRGVRDRADRSDDIRQTRHQYKYKKRSPLCK